MLTSLYNTLTFTRRENGHGEVDTELLEDNVSMNEDHANLNTPSTSKKRKLTGRILLINGRCLADLQEDGVEKIRPYYWFESVLILE